MSSNGWRFGFSPNDAVRQALEAVPEGFRVDALFSVLQDAYIVYVSTQVQAEVLSASFLITTAEMACARDLAGIILRRTISAVDAILAETMPTN